MKVIPTEIAGAVIIEPKIWEDARGYFMESFQANRFREHGLPSTWVQDNHSCSVRGTIRGLHYQLQHPQGKLIRAVAGAVLDVAVDLRRHSPTFGCVATTTLSSDNRRQFYVPPGCAHGFCALSDRSEIVYKCTDFYCHEHEYTLAWNDPKLAIQWPADEPLLSDKDRRGLPFDEAPYYDIGCEADYSSPVAR